MANLTYTTDTTEEAFEVQLACMRAMSPEERIGRVIAMSKQLKNMAFEAIRRANPDFDEQQVLLKFIEVTYGETLAVEVERFLTERVGERIR